VIVWGVEVRGVGELGLVKKVVGDQQKLSAGCALNRLVVPKQMVVSGVITISAWAKFILIILLIVSLHPGLFTVNLTK
jgi:hypothetical protein